MDAVCRAVTGSLTPIVGAEALRRFIPYVQMHEFEALLFSNPERFARALGDERLAREISRIREAFDSPESINDDPTTAPSKRILAIRRSYDKPLYGTLSALEIGLPTMRKECAQFDAWLQRLEALCRDGPR